MNSKTEYIALSYPHPHPTPLKNGSVYIRECNTCKCAKKWLSFHHPIWFPSHMCCYWLAIKHYWLQHFLLLWLDIYRQINIYTPSGNINWNKLALFQTQCWEKVTYCKYPGARKRIRGTPALFPFKLFHLNTTKYDFTWAVSAFRTTNGVKLILN